MAKLSEGECSASECGLICSESRGRRLQEAFEGVLFETDDRGLVPEIDDYWNSGYGRIIMVPRVKLAYDKVSRCARQNTPRRSNHLLTLTTLALTLTRQRVYDIIHPVRRNLTAIRGYKRLGGLPDDPHTDPQDKNWYGPHDRLFVPEEDEVLNFQPGPKYGESPRACQA